MARPAGKLTPAQYEILQLLWDAPGGLTVAEIWERITAARPVARTTVLNLVVRLDKRGWLKRRKSEGVFRYVAAVDRESTSGQMAAEFIEEFFDGSAADLMVSLIGTRKISNQEITQLRELLDEATPALPKRKGE